MQVHLGALMVLIHIRHYGVITLPSNKLKESIYAPVKSYKMYHIILSQTHFLYIARIEISVLPSESPVLDQKGCYIMMLLYCLATTSTAPFLNISQVYQVNQFGTSTDGPNNIIARACKCNAMQSIYT